MVTEAGSLHVPVAMQWLVRKEVQTPLHAISNLHRATSWSVCLLFSGFTRLAHTFISWPLDLSCACSFYSTDLISVVTKGLASLVLPAQVGMTHKWTFFLHKLTRTVAFTGKACRESQIFSQVPWWHCRDYWALTLMHNKTFLVYWLRRHDLYWLRSQEAQRLIFSASFVEQ